MTTSSLKTWMPLLVVAGGLVVSLVMNIVQKGQLEFLVNNMNEEVLPSYGKRIEAVEGTDDKQNEWIAYQKGLLQVGRYEKGALSFPGTTVEEVMKEKGGVSFSVGSAQFHFVPEKKKEFHKLRMSPAQADVGGK